MSDGMTLFGGNKFLAEFNTLPPDQRKALTQVLVQQQQQETIAELERSIQVERQERQEMQEKIGAKIEGLAEDMRDGIDAGIRRMKGADNYYTRTQIGKAYAPVISAKRMTRLLRAAQIVTQYADPMAKYRDGTEPLAKLKPFSEHETWLFHKAKLDERINKWLDENDIYEEFHNTATKNERDRFIDRVYEEFAGDLIFEEKR